MLIPKYIYSCIKYCIDVLVKKGTKKKFHKKINFSLHFLDFIKKNKKSEMSSLNAKPIFILFLKEKYLNFFIEIVKINFLADTFNINHWSW